MATHPHPAAPDDAPPWRLTDGLDAKLTELRALGYEVLWIESARADLTQLLVEGGDDAIRLDADPSLDRAWYRDVEIRHNAAREQTWVFLKGEVAAGEVSAHIVTRPV